MPTPVVEQITKNIQAIVAAISTQTGRHITILECQRRREPFNWPADMVAILSLLDSNMIQRETGREWWTQTFSIVVGCVEPESSGSPVDLRMLYAWGDISAALEDDRTRGGLAIDTRTISFAIASDAIEILVEVDYPITEGNPFIQT